MPPGRPPQTEIVDAIDAIQRAERLISSVHRAQIVDRLEELRSFVDELSRLTVDLRIARMRLQSHLAGASDPDRTPVQGISTASLPKVTPQK